MLYLKISYAIFIYLVHGRSERKTVCSPIRTQFHLSSANRLAPFTTKFGRNCNGVTESSKNEFKSSTDD